MHRDEVLNSIAPTPACRDLRLVYKALEMLLLKS